MPKFNAIAVALETLRFALRNWRTLIRLTWVPMTLVFVAGVVIAGLQSRRYSGSPFDAEVAAYLVGHATVWDISLFVLQVPMIAVAAVAVHRLALFNDSRPGEIFPLSIGRTDWLYVVMGVVLGSIVFAIDAVVLAVLHLMFVGAPSWSTVTGGFPESMDGVPSVPFNIAYWLSYAVVIALCARMLVWPAAVVARRDVSWAESWTLTRGRLLPLIALVVVSVLIAWNVPYWVGVGLAKFSVSIDFALGYEALPIALTLASTIIFWVLTVLFALLASFAYKVMRGYRPDETLPG
jgi:hypothetical protein